MVLKGRKTALLALTLGAALLLGGCRVRVVGGGGGSAALPAASESAADARGEVTGGAASASPVEPARPTEEEKPERPEAEMAGEDGRRIKENPDASRKEYDENAPAEIVNGADLTLHWEGEGNGAGAAAEEAARSVALLRDTAEQPAVRTETAEEADRLGVSPEAAEADSALPYFTVLLEDRVGSLFECKRLNLYWETDQDHVTIHKSAPEHALILSAGCYDVSARLLPENLRVSDGWVARKNPGVIVKLVDGGLLGRRVQDAGAARAVYESLSARDGWRGIDALRNSRILLLSREMLEAPWLRTAAAVLIARAAYPDLFSDVDPEEMLRMLAEEATGAPPAGLFYNLKEDEP